MPRWSALGEEGLLRRIRRIFATPPVDVRVPMGDDAALLRPARGEDIVLSTDQMVEGIHFRRETHPPELLGARALTVNLSDLASMGADPRWFLLSLLLPRNLPGAYLDGILQGMAREARRRGVYLVGGNLSAAPFLCLDVCAAGKLPPGRPPILRSGARPGDLLYVTGTLGGSALGLKLLDEGWRWKRGRGYRGGAPDWMVAPATRVLRCHLAPAPDYHLASLLSRNRLATAAIDISDGLSTDLWHLCRASRVGARLLESWLPVDEAVLRLRGRERGLDLALHGGEEYQLLFTVPAGRVGRLEKLTPQAGPRRIGILVPARAGVALEGADGRVRPLKPGGHDHLLRRSS